MHNILIHIGLSKTGTTFLQKDVFPKIKDCKVFYTQSVDITNIKENNIIISREWLTHSFRKATEFRRECRDNLKKQYPDAMILIVYRKKLSWSRSIYNQYVKAGGIHTYKTWLSNVDKDTFDFDALTEMYIEEFDKVLILSYESLKKNHYKFVDAICQIYGVKTPEYTNKVRNRSWNKYLTFAVMMFNRLFATELNDKPPIFPLCLHPVFWHRSIYFKSKKTKLCFYSRRGSRCPTKEEKQKLKRLKITGVSPLDLDQ